MASKRHGSDESKIQVYISRKRSLFDVTFLQSGRTLGLCEMSSLLHFASLALLRQR